MKNYIIDASVILNYSLKKNTILEKKLQSLFKESRKKRLKILAPDFIFVEVINGLRYSLRDEKKAQRHMNQILEFQVKLIHLSGNDYRTILNLSWQIKATTYDTAY